MAKKKRRVISTTNITGVKKDNETPMENVEAVADIPVEEAEIPMIPTPVLSPEENSRRYNNLRNFMDTGVYMDQIHMFSKKAEVITNILTDFYKVKLMKHGELIEMLNVDLFNVFEVLEIAVPDYKITGLEHVNENRERIINLIPNLTILFSSGNAVMRNKNLIITIIDVTVPNHEKNEDFLKFVDNVIQLFVALFPDCAIYSESIEYKANEEKVYNTIDFMFSHSKILSGLSITEDEFFALDDEEIFNITDDYNEYSPKADNMFLNLFTLIQNKNYNPSKLLLNDRLFYSVSVDGKRLNEVGEEVPMKLKFAYPVNIDIELEGEDDSNDYSEDEETLSDEEVQEQVVYSGRPAHRKPTEDTEDFEEDVEYSPEGMNDR